MRSCNSLRTRLSVWHCCVFFLYLSPPTANLRIFSCFHEKYPESDTEKKKQPLSYKKYWYNKQQLLSCFESTFLKITFIDIKYQKLWYLVWLLCNESPIIIVLTHQALPTLDRMQIMLNSLKWLWKEMLSGRCMKVSCPLEATAARRLVGAVNAVFVSSFQPPVWSFLCFMPFIDLRY